MLTAGVTGVFMGILLNTTSVSVNDIPVSTAYIEEVAEPELISLGEFKLTAYCSCVKCCGKWAYNRPDGIVKGASGKELIAGYSIAVDPKVIPYGTKVIIDGKEYEAMDCGGDIKGNRIDVYHDNHEECKKIGVNYAEVFINNGK